MPKKLTNDEFIEKAQQIHENKYDYSNVVYINNMKKVEIICKNPKHGSFLQAANNHLRGCGCPKCGKSIKLTKEEFIEKSELKHGLKYDYSKVVYVHSHKKVSIICKEHGEFEQSPNHHIIQGNGCPKCGKTDKRKKLGSNI